MDDDARRADARASVAAAMARGDAVSWFEVLYAGAADATEVPWADLAPNPKLTSWLAQRREAGDGRPTLVVGTGLGDDAEALAAHGFAVTAFDVAPSAVAWAARRFPGSSVDYRVADVRSPPAEWRGAFDLVFEAYTLQSLPADVRREAAAGVAQLVAPGGTLLVIATGRDPDEQREGPPWPLTRDELRDLFATLRLVHLEDFDGGETPRGRRLRAEFRAPGPADQEPSSLADPA